MFCVIQEVEVKTVSAGEPKGFVVDETKVTWDGDIPNTAIIMPVNGLNALSGNHTA